MGDIDVGMLQPGVANQPHVVDKVGCPVLSEDGGGTLSEVPLVKGVQDDDDSNVTRQNLANYKTSSKN